MTTSTPITSALVDALELLYTNPKVRDALYEVPGGELAIDLLLDYASNSDHADELEHFLRWESLNRQADDRPAMLHQTRVDALAEANVEAGNAFIDNDDLGPREGALDAFVAKEAYLGDKWRAARLAAEHAAEVQANLEEVLEASAAAKAGQ